MGFKAVPFVGCGLLYGMILLAPMLILPHDAAAQENEDPGPRLEGILQSGSPGSSLAIINGHPVAKGGKVGPYSLRDIQSSSVILQDADGKEKILSLEAASPASSPAVSPEVGQAAVAKEGSQTSPFSQLNNFNPVRWLELARQSAVIADLRQLYVQTQVYFAEYGSLPPLSELIDKGLVNPAFKEVKNGYVFRAETEAYGVAVFAEPAAAGTDKTCFMIDHWGNLRLEKGKAANAQSPLYSV